MNIFTQTHQDRDGNVTPIVSMDAEHLCNTVNMYLVRLPRKAGATYKARAFGEYAPMDMDDKARRALGRKKLTPEIEQRVIADLERIEASALEEGIERAMPYIVVGVARDDTRDGIIRILQEATGITRRIELPVYAPDDEDDDDGETAWLLEDGRDDLPF